MGSMSNSNVAIAKMSFACPEDLISFCQEVLDRNEFKRVRETIEAHHSICRTDEIKLQLLHVWEQSLYNEFIATRLANSPVELDMSQPGVRAKVLSNSMRYKLRKKYPCPIELEHELKVKNARLPKPVHDGLNEWLKQHVKNPYPNKVEKEELGGRLGITPQQVNRWFIQRRKMLRIRGDLYLGRGESGSAAPAKKDGGAAAAMMTHEDYDDDDYDDERGDMVVAEDEDEAMDNWHQTGDDDSHAIDESRAHLKVVHPRFRRYQEHQEQQQQEENASLMVSREEDPDSHTQVRLGRHSMLEKLLHASSQQRAAAGGLTLLQQQQQQIISNQSLGSGGSVEVMEQLRQIEEARRASVLADDAFTPLTPPPSLSGDSMARATPPEVPVDYTTANSAAANVASAGQTTIDQREALDLTVKQEDAMTTLVATPKSSPVILEPQSPGWRPTMTTKMPHADHLYTAASASPLGQSDEDGEISEAEQIAAKALLALARSG